MGQALSLALPGRPGTAVTILWRFQEVQSFALSAQRECKWSLSGLPLTGHTCPGQQCPFLSSYSQFYMGFPKSSCGVQAPLLPLTSIFHPTWHRLWSHAATVPTRGCEALEPCLDGLCPWWTAFLILVKSVPGAHHPVQILRAGHSSLRSHTLGRALRSWGKWIPGGWESAFVFLLDLILETRRLASAQGWERRASL